LYTSYVYSGSETAGLYMMVWIIGALPLEHGIDDTHELVGHKRERDQMVFAPLTLAIIDSSRHQISATGCEGGMLDGATQVGRAPLAHFALPGRLPRLMQLWIHAG
jgi:hypothetical protein